MKYKTLGEFLKYFMDDRKVTYEYIAHATGKTKGMISHYVSGIRNPSKDFIEKFLKSFKLTKEEKENFILVAELGKTEILKNELTKYNITDDTRFKELNKKEIIKYESFMEGANLFFNDESIDDEDKDKLMASLNNLYFRAKAKKKERKEKRKAEKNK